MSQALCNVRPDSVVAQKSLEKNAVSFPVCPHSEAAYSHPLRAIFPQVKANYREMLGEAVTASSAVSASHGSWQDLSIINDKVNALPDYSTADFIASLFLWAFCFYNQCHLSNHPFFHTHPNQPVCKAHIDGSSLRISTEQAYSMQILNLFSSRFTFVLICDVVSF